MFEIFDNASVAAFLLGAVLTLAVAAPMALALGGRFRRLREENQRLADEAEQGREILAAAPDGLFVWDQTTNEERCSRRLAVMLGLNAGTGATFEDVKARFAAPEAAALQSAADDLHRLGASFDLLLKLDSRTIQATGVRASALDGKPLDDLMWMRDVSDDTPADRSKESALDTAALDHFHQLLDALPLAVWIRDGNHEVVFSNRADKLVSASASCRALAERARAENRPLSESIYLDDNGVETLFEVGEVPARGWNGAIGFARKHPGRVGENEQGGLAVLDNLSTAIAIFGPNRRLRFCNDAYASLWRFEPDWLADEPSLSEILDRLRQNRQLPEVADFREFKERQGALFGGLNEPEDTLLHLPDGRTLRATVAPHAPGGLVFSYQDVSDRLDLERSLKTLNAVQRETLDNLYEGIAVFGSDGRMKLSNPAFARLWGLSDTILAARPHLNDIINATRPLIADIENMDDREWRDYVGDLVARYTGRQPVNGRIQLNDTTVLDYSSVPLPDGAVLLSYLDVSDSARVEAALRQRAEALDQANRLKSEFIANVSYEVRTPLTTLKGFADILAEQYFGELNERQREYCLGILDSADSLASVISDILDMASIEAGMMTLELDTVDIHSMLASVLGLLNERTRHRELEIDFDCPPDIGWIVADEKRLKQVLFHLLSNAVKESPPRGVIRLRARRGGDGDDAVVNFMVIARQAGPQIGAGLGLSLVRRFVELHGGEVEVRSPQGKETTITCRLPATAAQAVSTDDSLCRSRVFPF